MGIDRIAPKGNKRRAEQELIRIRSEFEVPRVAGELSSNMLFADYLDQWLEIVRARIKPATFGSYQGMVKSTIGPYFRKKELFGDNATLCITGRDVEEKKLKMQMCGVKWEITEELSTDDLRKERIPDFVFKVVDFLFEHRQFEGTVTELLAAVGNTELKPNVASKYLTRFYSEVFAPMGITYEYRKTAAARTISLMLNDGADGNDGLSGTERLASLRAKNDGIWISFRLIPLTRWNARKSRNISPITTGWMSWRNFLK